MPAFCGNERVSTLQTWTEAGALAAPIHPGFQTRYAASYRAEMDHFADILAGEAEPLTGYAASIGASALAEAAAESVRSGAPVRL